MAGTTRKRILEYLTSHSDASTGQIARALGTRLPAIRHHLKILRNDGRIRVTSKGPPTRSGRPENHFRLSELLQGNNLAMVADVALRATSVDAPKADPELLVLQLVSALLARLGDARATEAAARRMDALTASLNELHYAARWEAGAEGPRLYFGHCPYAAIIKDHPELCRMDAQAVSDFTRAQIRQLAKIDVDTARPSHCLFSLR